MSRSLPKVLILYTGGTFGMDIHSNRNQRSVALAVPLLSPHLLKKRLLDRVPEIQSLARCDVDVILNRDSSHIGPPEWILFAETIRKKWKNYNGIVLLHGTDTMAYTASALSFLLRPCLVPIVITGAQRPLMALRTDARSNLISSVEIAARGPRHLVKQVTVFFRENLYQGNRVRKVSASDFSAFASPHVPPLAGVGTTIRYSEYLKVIPPSPIRLLPRFDRQVLFISVAPGFPSNALSHYLMPHIDGIVMVVYHSWTAPTHDPAFLKFLTQAKALQIPIVIVTQDSSQQPGTEGHRMNYAAGKVLQSEGCLSAEDMTPECAYVKTLLLLSQNQRNIKKFASLWKQNLAGEFSK